MSEIAFDNIASCGLLNEEQVDVLGAHLADALQEYVKAFGVDTPVRISFVLQPV